MLYNIQLDGDTLRLAFGDPATNAQIVPFIADKLAEMKSSGELVGGPLLKINGPASLPAAFAIGHAVTHLFGSIAVWDPKLQKYVVAVSHNGEHKVGDLVE